MTLLAWVLATVVNFPVPVLVLLLVLLVLLLALLLVLLLALLLVLLPLLGLVYPLHGRPFWNPLAPRPVSLTNHNPSVNAIPCDLSAFH